MNTDDLIFTLKNDISAEVIQQIRNDKTIYQDFKQSVINSFANKIFDENLMGFALLTALNFDDNEFIEMLSNHFDFDDDKYSFRHKKIRNAWITFAKAYVCLKNSKRDFAKAIFWKIFAEVSPDYFNKNDFLVLNKLFAEMENSGESYFLLLSYCIAKFANDNLDFKISMAQFQLDNMNNELTKHLHFEKNYQSNLNLLSANINDPIKLNQIAEYCSLHNDKENFFRFNELAILNINTNLPILPPPPIIPYNSETCLESVNKIIDILESIGEKPFLEGGTLLGMYREGKLIEFDYDADIGIIIDNSKYTNKQNMKNYVNKIIRLILADSSFKSIIVCDDEDYYYLLNIFDKHMNHIDLSFFYKNFFNEPNNNSLYTGCPSTFTPLLWECSNFNLVRKNFAGKEYWVPDDTEKYLIENYGENWRTPIKSFSNYENIPKQCKLGYFYRYFPVLIESLRRKNYDRSIIYYEKLQRWEYPFTSAMKNHIENYLEQIKTNEK
ncbi:MAG: hypothetical protein ACI4PS_00105 [Rhodocyclaceae bacterium]